MVLIISEYMPKTVLITATVSQETTAKNIDADRLDPNDDETRSGDLAKPCKLNEPNDRSVRQHQGREHHIVDNGAQHRFFALVGIVEDELRYGFLVRNGLPAKRSATTTPAAFFRGGVHATEFMRCPPPTAWIFFHASSTARSRVQNKLDECRSWVAGDVGERKGAAAVMAMK